MIVIALGILLAVVVLKAWEVFGLALVWAVVCVHYGWSQEVTTAGIWVCIVLGVLGRIGARLQGKV